jgi:hypothetical protein
MFGNPTHPPTRRLSTPLDTDDTDCEGCSAESWDEASINGIGLAATAFVFFDCGLHVVPKIQARSDGVRDFVSFGRTGFDAALDEDERLPIPIDVASRLHCVAAHAVTG